MVPLLSASLSNVTALVSDSAGVWLIGVAVDELLDVTAGPLGGVAVADAVLMIDPALTSPWVMILVAVQVIVAPGARVVDGQVMVDRPGIGSLMLRPVSVTLPAFVAANENVCMSPRDAPAGAVSVVITADLASDSAGVWLIGVAVDELLDVTAGPLGGVPFAVAVLLIDPALTSAWVMVRVAVQVVDAPGVSVVDGQLMVERPGIGSLMLRPVSVTLPAFVAANENVWVSPSDAPMGAVSVVITTDLVSVMVLVWLIGVAVDELLDVTAGPLGGVPEADAVLMIDPALTSVWVMIRVAVQVVEALGASVVDGQVMADRPGNGSLTLKDVRVTLPVFVAANENVCMSPRDAPGGAVSVVIAADLISDSAGVWVIGVFVDDGADVTSGPDGGVPFAVAVLLIDPALTSAWVMVRVAVQVVEALGVSVVDGQLMVERPGRGSLMATDVRVTLPVLVTRNENVWVSPSDAPAGAVSVVMATDLVSVMVLVWSMGVAVDELLEITAGPLGGVPEADSVLMIDPAFTSAWVMVRVALHVVDSPGANVVAGQVMADRPGRGSLMLTEVRVTLPVLDTANEKVCVSPIDAPVGVVSVVNATLLLSDRVFTCAIGVFVDDGAVVTSGPLGGVAVAVAVLLIEPELTSAWVMVRVAVQVVEALGANVVAGQLMAERPDRGSVMVTDVRVTLPVLVTANENVWVSPSDAPVGAVSVVIATDLVSVMVLVWSIGVAVDELLEATAGPLGGVAVADAVLMIDPAFTSAWVMVRVAVHVVEAPGANVVAGQVMADRPGIGSLMLRPVSVTLPVLVTANEKVCVSPSDAPVGAVSVVNADDLANDSAGVWVIGVLVDDGAEVTSGPDGGVPFAVAVLLIDPALTSAWVMVRVAVQVVDAPGASVGDGQLMLERPTSGSVMVTDVRVTLPVLVTRNENVWVSPSDAPAGAVSVVMATDLVSVMVLVWLIGVAVDELLDVMAGPLGGVPVADAVLMIDPAFTSVWVMVRVAVQVVEAPGANVVAGQVMADRPGIGSLMLRPVSVTLPVLDTANEKVCVSPSDAPGGAVSVVIAADFTNDSVFV